MRMRGKPGIVFSGLFIVSLFLFAGSAQALSLTVNARSAILMEVPGGRVLWEQNADSPIPPASVTKIMSLYLIYEAIEGGRAGLYDLVPISRRAASTGGSRMNLKAGTKVPLDVVMKGMAVASGNDACVAAAEYISGSVEDFVRLMNDKARTLGMTSTTFMNPNGLPAKGQVTTARDMAKLSLAYLKRFPNSLPLHSTKTYVFGNSVLKNRNRLLGHCPGVDGIKTGYVGASGYNLSATAKRGNTRLLAVLLGASNAVDRAVETTRILEEGFAMLAPTDPAIAAVAACAQSTEELREMYRAEIGGVGRARASKAVHHRYSGKKGRGGSHRLNAAASQSAGGKNVHSTRVKGKAGAGSTREKKAADSAGKGTASEKNGKADGSRNGHARTAARR